MDVLRSYIVRIYRQGREGMAGTIESVESGVRTSFQSETELWESMAGISNAEIRRGGGAEPDETT